MIEQIKTLRAEGKTDAEVLEALNAKTVKVVNPDPVSMGDSLIALVSAGIDGNLIAGAFQSAGPIGEAGVTRWAAEGLQFNHPATLALMSSLVGAGAFPQSAMDLLVALSEWYVSPWEDAGNESPMTQSDLDALEDAESIRLTRETALASVQTLVDPLQSKLNAMSTWLTTEASLAMSPADYQAYADSLLATDDGNPPSEGE
jgi:hypothetical protein